MISKYIIHYIMNKKIKLYSIKQVEKHNKKNDAWIIYKGYVYDITKWIPNHPGGNIIMKGVGKKIDNLFTKFHSHSDNAKNIMKQFKIGKLKKQVKKTKKLNKNKLKKSKKKK